MIKITNIQIIEDRIIFTVDVVSVIRNYVFSLVEDIQNLEQMIKDDLVIPVREDENV